MSTGGGGYLLAGGAAGLERLQLQARVWEPEAGRCSIGSVSRPAPMHRPRLRRNGHSPAAQPARRTIGPRRGRRFGCKAARGCARVLKEAGLSNVEILGLDARLELQPLEFGGASGQQVPASAGAHGIPPSLSESSCGIRGGSAKSLAVLP